MIEQATKGNLKMKLTGNKQYRKIPPTIKLKYPSCTYQNHFIYNYFPFVCFAYLGLTLPTFSYLYYIRLYLWSATITKQITLVSINVHIYQ